MATHAVRVRRVYEDAGTGEGTPVLVDGMWPRGVRKADLDVDWVKNVAPSKDLRQWFGHDPDKFAEFRRRYRDELGADERHEALQWLHDTAARAPLTLLTATKDVEHSHAAVLAEVLRERR